MDVFEQAKEMELEGQRMYEEQMTKTSHEGLKKILKMLADEEYNHYAIFEAMQKKEDPVQIKPLDFADVKSAFSDMKTAGEKFDFADDVLPFYEKALQIEKNSEAYYLKQAEGFDDPKIKGQFLRVAAEENKHVILMQNMIEFVNRPNEWVENAEFNKMDEY